MKSKISYFKLTLKDNEKGITFGVNHNKICKKWIHHFNIAIKYTQARNIIRTLTAAEQIVEFLDD